MIKRTRLQVYKLWLKALRSGGYRQATKTLRSTSEAYGDSFCCLGVLCDLAAMDGGQQWTEAGHYDGESASLSDNMRQFMGLTDANLWRLISLNDKFGCSFPTIADEVENKIMPKALVRGVK